MLSLRNNNTGVENLETENWKHWRTLKTWGVGGRGTNRRLRDTEKTLVNTGALDGQGNQGTQGKMGNIRVRE